MRHLKRVGIGGGRLSLTSPLQPKSKRDYTIVYTCEGAWRNAAVFVKAKSKKQACMKACEELGDIEILEVLPPGVPLNESKYLR